MGAAAISKENFWLRIIYVVSVVIAAAVAFLILGPRPEGSRGETLIDHPLVLGQIAVKNLSKVCEEKR